MLARSAQEDLVVCAVVPSPWPGESAQACSERWVEQIETAAGRAPAVVGRGSSWEEAIDDVEWREGDVLVVGSSSAAPAARVFRLQPKLVIFYAGFEVDCQEFRPADGLVVLGDRGRATMLVRVVRTAT